MAVEIELKFQVPSAARAALRRAVQTPSAQLTRLRAVYVDTSDRRLATAGMALRLRQQGRLWVQTVKVGGGLVRLEHEVALPPVRGRPTIDLTRHNGTPAGRVLQEALGADAPPLEPVFETDVQRTHRVLRSGDAAIELALDLGELRAGTRRQPLHEFELELKSGSIGALFALADRWVERHGLWLDVRGKSELGHLLARDEPAAAPVLASTPKLDAHQRHDAALRAMVASCLAQLLPNAAAVAAETGGAEHLHQLRVAMRRLRGVLRLFGSGAPGVDAGWEPALAALFDQLGAARDADALRDDVLPAIVEAGAPPFDWPAAGGTTPASTLLRATPNNRLWLSLMAYAHGAPAVEADEADRKSLLDALAAPLRRLHRQVKRDARDFTSADIAQRHRTRKRIKRLRYGAEAIAALLPGKAMRRYLAGLRPAQEALGDYNDLLVAEAALARDELAEPGHWFARGWLAARREVALSDAAAALCLLPPLPAALKR